MRSDEFASADPDAVLNQPSPLEDYNLFGADTPLSEINALRCEGVFEFFQQRDLAPTTQNTELKALNSLFNYAVKVELMTRNPAKGLRAKEPPPREQKHPLDSDDLRKVFSQCLAGNGHISFDHRRW